MESLLPPALEAWQAFALVAASFFTSALTAAFGIGGGVALISLMGYLLPVSALIPVHGLVQLGSNAGRLWIQRSFAQWHAIFPFLFGSVLGALVGAPLVVSLDDGLLKIALGIFIIAISWVRLPGHAAPGRAWFALGGFITTFLTMFFGATGPLTAIFFEKTFPDRRHYAASHAAAMTAQHALKAAAFALAGFAFSAWLPLLVLMVASGYLGTMVGSRLLLRVSEKQFRLVFRWLLTLLGIDLARRGLVAYLG
ncbi:MAG: sulfite exporter TauE/SafE family protein [Rhizobiaceae bacterium]